MMAQRRSAVEISPRGLRRIAPCLIVGVSSIGLLLIGPAAPCAGRQRHVEFHGDHGNVGDHGKLGFGDCSRRYVGND